MIINLGASNSIVNQFVFELRDAEIQKDSLRFRKNMERLGEIFAYEISKKMDYEPTEVNTSLGSATVPVLKKQPVIATILRAGLPLHQGVLNVFDRAHNAFVFSYRMHHKDGSFDIKMEYVSAPEFDQNPLLISDPMLATGSSMVLAYKELIKYGTPAHTHIISIVASSEGITYLKRNLPDRKVTIWVAAIDDELTAQAYIVPGLGDAGDLAFGNKI